MENRDDRTRLWTAGGASAGGGRFNSGDFGDDQPPNGVPDNVDVICDLTPMCPDDPTVRPNIHLNTKGYRVVAKAFLASLAG